MEKKILMVYGPYISKRDGRKRVIIVYDDKSKTTRSLARFMYEQENGKIDPALTVDHVDENPFNDVMENFQLLTRSENAKKARQFKQLTEWYEGVCLECNKLFMKPMRQIRHNQGSQNKPGPFCGKSCAGRFNQRKQKEFRKPNSSFTFQINSVIEIK